MVATVQGFDAIHANIASLPRGQAAGYVTGTADIMWTAEDWAAHPRAVRIDQSPVNTPLDETADVLDFEYGAATISDIAPWAKAAYANYRSAVRPGQRTPAVYASKDSIAAVVAALSSAGITSVGLWVADWMNDQAAAIAEVANPASVLYPVIGVQYHNAGSYDESVFSVPWLTRVSANMDTAFLHAEIPPGQWKDATAWTWQSVTVAGTGLDGKIHSFALDVTTGGWAKLL